MFFGAKIYQPHTLFLVFLCDRYFLTMELVQNQVSIKVHTIT